MTEQKILLLGATGFIGNAVLHTLLDAGHTVMALQHSKRLLIQHERLHIIHAAIGSLNVSSLPHVPGVVIHAARNKAGRFGKIGRAVVARKGAAENRRLLKQLANLDTRPAIVYCSGSLMYGSHEGLVIDETFPTAPVSFAREYIAAEQPFLDALDKPRLNIIMLRLPWVIGGGSWFQWNYINIMRSRHYVPLYGAADNIMSFVDVNIIGKAIMELVSAKFRGLFNLHHPQCLSQKEWAAIVSSASGLPVAQLSAEERALFSAAAMEAFNTNIALGSVHAEIQQRLRPLHKPLEEVVRSHLPSLQHK